MNAARAVSRPWIVPDVADASPMARPRLAAPPPPVPVLVSATLAEPPAVYGETDIAAAREQGQHDGALLAAQTAQAQVAGALQDIARSLQSASEAATELGQRTAIAMGTLLLQALAAAFPALEARFGPREASLLARAVLPGLLREPAVSVRVAPAAVEALAAELARLPDAARAGFTIESDAALGDADIRIGWRDGEAVRDGAAIRLAVLEALSVLAEDDAMERNEA